MIFLDNASTTKIYDESLNQYIKASNECYFNPGALYNCGNDISKKIEQNKKEIVSLLGGNKFDNLIFTSGATESNNLAIMGSIKSKNSNLVFSMGEHPSVYNVAKNLEQQGYNVQFVNLTKDGNIDFEDFKEKVNSKTSFISIMHVSNETGAVNDIKKLVEYAKYVNPNVIFHSDGVQAVGKIKVNLSNLGVDLYTMSSHKIHGPKGIGALFVKKDIVIKPIVYGGGQENGLRSGTENYPAIEAFKTSLNIIVNNINKNMDILQNLNVSFKTGLKQEIPTVVFNGENKSNHIVSFSLLGARAETILHMLDDNGVLVSNGSACSTKNKGNRILKNMGLSNDIIEGALRVSFSDFNTIEEIETAIKIIKKVYDEYIKKVK